MSSFDGFKEDDDDGASGLKSASMRIKNVKKPKSFSPKDVNATGFEPIPSAAKLSVTNKPIQNPDLIKNLKENGTGKDDDKANNRKTSEKVDVSTDPTSCNDSESVAADEEQDVNAAQKLERMTERRKAIERENKRKKEVLAQTIAARKQQTNNEAEKLKAVQSELTSIESELALDVRLLMDAIQCASVDYSDAQKRYERIEKEFVAAKLDLQVKSEKKELLMEHLATIIEQNEIRKAEKLAKIMEELGLH